MDIDGIIENKYLIFRIPEIQVMRLCLTVHRRLKSQNENNMMRTLRVKEMEPLHSPTNLIY